ncbi:MAG: biopolymer transporter ExbD [Leptolyngbya sp. PLA3]|nr:MAG: biopolymer transporter ExbD [Cyanobacteria bacterium CYA]MCE7967624.1 biopolymer transporter ExbD [Leptolyngbya sp. PL-A3]
MRLIRRSNEPGRVISLPMTSMIDVVFLLLIFFLVTANFSEREDRLEATIQSERSGSGPSDLQPQIVSVQMSGGHVVFRVGERAVQTGAALRVLLEQLPKEAGVAIKVDDRVPIQAAATALQAAHDAGFIKRTYVPATGEQ